MLRIERTPRDIASVYETHRTLKRQYPDDARLLWRQEEGTIIVRTSDTAIAEYAVGAVREFRLFANPTVCRDTAPRSEGRQRARKRSRLVGAPAQLDWLHRKAEIGGFEIMDAVVHGSRHVRCKNDRHGALLLGVEFRGVLRVTDAARFAETLRQGIGRGKAWGFGLLVVG